MGCDGGNEGCERFTGQSVGCGDGGIGGVGDALWLGLLLRRSVTTIL
jgi:hypothetical protein